MATGCHNGLCRLRIFMVNGTLLLWSELLSSKVLKVCFYPVLIMPAFVGYYLSGTSFSILLLFVGIDHSFRSLLL